MAKVVDLPALSSKVPSEIRKALINLHQSIKSVGESGSLSSAETTKLVAAAVDAVSSSIGPSRVPGAPDNLVAQGAYNQILLSVDPPDSSWEVRYVVWLRATVDNPNQAEVIARAGFSYADAPDDARLSKKYYYWAKFENALGEGPLNQTAGTLGETADEPGYVLDTLVADKWESEADYAVDSVSTPTRMGGRVFKCTVAGTSGTAEPDWPSVVGDTIVDGGVTWELVTTDLTLERIFKIALVNGDWVAAIRELFVQNLTAENFVGKEIIADKLSAVLATTYQQIVGWMLQSSDGLVQLDMANKMLKMQDSSSGDYVQITPASMLYRSGTTDVFKFENGDVSIRSKTTGDLVFYSGSGLTASMIADLGDLATQNRSNLNYEDGADKTSSNTAAGIVGQGALATVSQITPYNASTYIADLAVNTLQIADNAVTVPEGASISGAIIPPNNVERTLISDAINSQGQPVFISATWMVNYSSAMASTIRIKRGGTTIATFPSVMFFFLGASSYSVLSGISWVDRSPSTGTNTYSITAQGHPGTFSMRTISLIGLKR